MRTARCIRKRRRIGADQVKTNWTIESMPIERNRPDALPERDPEVEFFAGIFRLHAKYIQPKKNAAHLAEAGKGEQAGNPKPC